MKSKAIIIITVILKEYIILIINIKVISDSLQ